LESVEDKLTNRRSKNILTKLRTNEVITNEDLAAASDAAWAAAGAAAGAAQAKWVRKNFKLYELNIN